MDDGILLNTGATMPRIGCGTYTLKGDTAAQAVSAALERGIRLVDTAWIYDNEKDVGTVWPKFCTRESIFLTSKLWRSHQSFDQKAILTRLRQSLRRLQTTYLDLWLLHWPGPGHHRFQRHQVPLDWTPAMRVATWRAMEAAQALGLVRAIGVSNCTVDHLVELLAHGTIRPAVNQVELHPLLTQTALRDFCRKEGIVVQAYASLGAGNARLLNHPQVLALGAAKSLDPAQILLSWALGHGLAVIPRSTNKDHVAANTRSGPSVLLTEEMAALDALDEGRRLCWNGVDPATVPLLGPENTTEAPAPAPPIPQPKPSKSRPAGRATSSPSSKPRRALPKPKRSPPDPSEPPPPAKFRFAAPRRPVEGPPDTTEGATSPDK
jgi:diketogulonate reductase-like aldo/keto reductase